MAKVYERNKPKLTITVDQEVLDVLQELREYTGTNVSGFINGMLYESLPIFRQMIEAHKLVRAKDPRAVAIMQETIQKTTQDAQKAMSELEKGARKGKGKGKAEK